MSYKNMLRNEIDVGLMELKYKILEKYGVSVEFNPNVVKCVYEGPLSWR